MPTPRPAKKRPAINIGSLFAAVWRMTPKLNTQHAVIRDHLLPILSAKGAALRAPTKVPAERIETTNDVCDESMFKWPSESV